MATKDRLILAIEFLVAGEKAVIPAELRRPEFDERGFQDEIRRFRIRMRPWVTGPGIQGVGIGEKIKDGRRTGELALKFYVASKKDVRSVRNPIETSLDVPHVGTVLTDVQEVGQIRLESFTGSYRPPAPGCSACHFDSGSKGTLGLIVEPDAPDGKAYILSCSHVIAMNGLGQVGDIISQPSPWDGGTNKDQIARLSNWVPFDFSSVGHPNRVDAAIAKATIEVTNDILLIGYPAGVSHHIFPGMTVQKTGRTTEHTCGEVIDDYFFTHITYKTSAGSWRKAYFRDQVLCSRFTAPGDSGAAVLNAKNEVVGLHFAGSDTVSIFNRIEHVCNLLQVQIT